MDIPTEFKGKVYFYWSPEYGWFSVFDEKLDLEDKVFLGSSDEIHVRFNRDEAVLGAVDALDKKIENVRMEMLHKIEVLKGRKQALLSLEHEPEDA